MVIESFGKSQNRNRESKRKSCSARIPATYSKCRMQIKLGDKNAEMQNGYKCNKSVKLLTDLQNRNESKRICWNALQGVSNLVIAVTLESIHLKPRLESKTTKRLAKKASDFWSQNWDNFSFHSVQVVRDFNWSQCNRWIGHAAERPESFFLCLKNM